MNKNTIALSILALIGLSLFLVANSNKSNNNSINLNDLSTQTSTPTPNEPADTPILGESDQDNSVSESNNLNESETMKLEKPEMQIDETKNYQATLKTSEGGIKINLFQDKTPITVNNFVYLANQDFYNDVIFHRVIDSFMIQGGDPTGTGSGGPGYKFDDEPFEGEYTRGIVAMANSGPNTNGSQFFIMHQDNPLPKNYVIFGEVIEGMDVVDKIATAETELSATGEQSKPIDPVVIEEVEVIVE